MTMPNFHVINALPPVADAYSLGGGANDTDIIDAGAGDGVLFILHNGVSGGAATNTITIEASSTIGAAAVATVPYYYRECVSTDVWGAWTASAKAGTLLTMTASNSMWQIWVDSSEIIEEGYQYVRLSTDETGNFEVLAGILAIIVNPRYSPTISSALD